MVIGLEFRLSFVGCRGETMETESNTWDKVGVSESDYKSPF